MPAKHKSERLDPTRHTELGAKLADALRHDIVGQPEAVDAIVDQVDLANSKLSPPGRPLGSFMFLGPTGVGKTRLVEAVAEHLLGDPRAFLRVDCGEFQHSHEIAKLIGSPPGYLGHRETRPMLSQEAVNQYQTDKIQMALVLFDEIEKANDALRSLLLGILDKATLTLGDNRRVDFSRTFIFMTSNLGAQEMTKSAQGGIGFADVANAAGRDATKVREIGLKALRKRFTPEFVNRLDRVVVFSRLGPEALREIVELELDGLRRRLTTVAPVVLTLRPEATEWVLARGADLRYGARELRRVLEREVLRPVAMLVATRQVGAGDAVEVGVEMGELVFDRRRV